jgi:FeS assembly SUF system regulator
MIRMGRLTDYGIVLMSYVAAHPEGVHTATEVASGVRLPLPTVSKLMRGLAREGLLASHRGVKGGYRLSRPAECISVGEIINALEGPIALTMCTGDGASDCEYEPLCPLRGPWQRINRIVRQALESISLSEMASPEAPQVRGPRPLTAGTAAPVR